MVVGFGKLQPKPVYILSVFFSSFNESFYFESLDFS